MRNSLFKDPAVFITRRRFSDPVSPLNDELHDQTRLLATAVAMIDHLGIEILSVEADRTRNRRIQVMPGPEVEALGGVEVARQNGWSHWCATRHGVEIRWCVPMEAA